MQKSEADIGRLSGKLQYYNLEPGGSETLQWGMMNVGDGTITVYLEISGEGSEFVTFPESVDIPPKSNVYANVTVTIPSDYPTDVYLAPSLMAVELADPENPIRISIAIRQYVEMFIGNAVKPEIIAEPVAEQVAAPEPQEEEIQEPEETKEPGSFTIKQSEEEGGGCLISTATFGSELAPQVQMLREIRDNKLLSTESGSTFMTGFNTLYYSFSPTIADLERQSPIFREVVQITITPLITSLSILNYIDMDSEAEVLVYGISLIMLNVGMYFVAPAVLITKLRRKV